MEAKSAGAGCGSRNLLFRVARGAAGALAAWSAAAAGFAAEPAAAPEVAAPPAAATAGLGRWFSWVSAERRELALGLRRFEAAYFAARPQGQAMIEANRSFDDLAREFMKGGFAETSRLLDRLTRKLDPAQDAPEFSVAWALRIRVEPQAGLQGATKEIRLRTAALYDAGAAAPLQVRFRDPAGKTFEAQPAAQAAPGVEAVATLPLPESPSLGAWKVEWLGADGRVLRTAPFWMLAETPESTRKRLEAAVGAAAGEAPLATVAEVLGAASAVPAEPLQDARDAFAARLRWLSSTMDGSSTTPIAVDLSTYGRDLEQEAKALRAGANPYVGRTGDWWASFRSGATAVPLRVVAPPQKGASSAKLPLVIAFHGTGGDENMFSFAYGRGRLAQLAQERGFLLVCPSTYPFVAQDKHFPRLLEWIERLYPVDRSRVYVMGHSLGGITASRLAASYPERVSKAVCLAGLFVPPTAEKLPPTAVFSAELDRIIPAVHLKSLTAELVARGLPVRCTELAHLGHTMMVEACLSDAVDFLTLVKPGEEK